MHALERRAPAPVPSPAAARPNPVERRLRLYRPELRSAVSALARRHARLGDLALSFPALLVALARPRPRFDPAEAIAAVIEGRPLGEIAWLCGVPLWLRKFEPQLLAGPIPELPDTALFRRMIVNHLPRSPRHSAQWLDIVAAAARDGTEPFAVWCARHCAKAMDAELKARLPLLSLFAWYSAQASSPDFAPIEQRWTLAMTVKNAVDAAVKWLMEIELYLYLGEEALADVWFETACVDGFEFVPLRNADDIREEARAMQNCLRTYGFVVAAGNTRLWSIRKDGARRATLGVERYEGSSLLSITELQAEKNEPATDDVCLAVQRWLLTRERLGPLPPFPDVAATLPVRKAWRTLWKPYWLAKGGFPAWLPLAPTFGGLGILHRRPPRRRRRQIR